MKKLLVSFLLCALLFSCGGNKEELTVKTENLSGAVKKSTFKVWGNCETCKDAIENALRVDGISASDWNMESKLIAVTYDTTKVSLDMVEQKIAAAGYDNVKYKGDDKAYANLPACCKYDRK